MVDSLTGGERWFRLRSKFVPPHNWGRTTVLVVRKPPETHVALETFRGVRVDLGGVTLAPALTRIGVG